MIERIKRVRFYPFLLGATGFFPSLWYFNTLKKRTVPKKLLKQHFMEINESQQVRSMEWNGIRRSNRSTIDVTTHVLLQFELLHWRRDHFSLLNIPPMTVLSYFYTFLSFIRRNKTVLSVRWALTRWVARAIRVKWKECLRENLFIRTNEHLNLFERTNEHPWLNLRPILNAVVSAVYQVHNSQPHSYQEKSYCLCCHFSSERIQREQERKRETKRASDCFCAISVENEKTNATKNISNQNKFELFSRC